MYHWAWQSVKATFFLHCFLGSCYMWLVWCLHFKTIKSSLYLRYYAKVCNEWRGPSPLLNLRGNVATVVSVSDTVFNLTNTVIEPQTSRTDIDVLIQNVKIKSSLSSKNQTYSYGLEISAAQFFYCNVQAAQFLPSRRSSSTSVTSPNLFYKIRDTRYDTRYMGKNHNFSIQDAKSKIGHAAVAAWSC